MQKDEEYRMNQCKYFKSTIYVLLFIICIISAIVSFNPTLGTDEPFTISLIKHTYSQIWHIDLLDVHPPLYYLLLKVFLNITTFWTKSIVIKIMSARLFSFIIFLISCYLLLKILELLHINASKNKILFLFLLFFMIPSVEQYSLFIRMYQLAAMFLVVELFGILLFQNGCIFGLLLSLISVSMASYTNYFAAMFAGSLLFVYSINYLIRKRYRNFLLMILTIIGDALLFIPGSYFLIHQLKYVSSYHYYNFVNVPLIGRNILVQLAGCFSGHDVGSFLSLLIVLAIMIIELICLFNLSTSYSYFHHTFANVYLAFIIGLIPSIVLSIIKHPMIMGRYGFPMSSIILFFTISSILFEKKYRLVFVFVVIFLVALGINNLRTNTIIINHSIDPMYTSILNNRRKNSYLRVKSSNVIYASTYLNIDSHKKIISKNCL